MRPRVSALAGRAADVLPAAAVTALALAELFGGDGFYGPAAVNVAAIVVLGAALLLRRRRPGASAAGVAAAVGGQALAVGTPESAGEFLGVLLSVGSVAAHARGRERRLGMAALIAANLVAFSRDRLIDSFDDALPGTAIALAAWAIGDLLGRRTDQAAEARAAHARAEALREAEAREAVALERSRIAREIHDVIAHGLGAITVQAGAGRLDAADDATRERLQVIERTARESLLELRRLLGVLRRPDDGPALAPQPTLAGLGALAATARGAGLQVDLRVDGSPEDVPSGLQLTAYRIVQEALTNVVRHAGATRCDVVVRRRDGHLELEVADDGRGGDGEGGGFGLVGMRERAHVFGGTLAAGPRQGAPGFVVRARLPIGGPA